MKKQTLPIFSIVLGCLLLVGGFGCHKHSAGTTVPKTLPEGIANLRAALATANPVVQSNLYHGVVSSVHAADYARASLALQEMAGDPSLNDQQKKAVNDVLDLLKQEQASPQNAAPPAK